MMACNFTFSLIFLFVFLYSVPTLCSNSKDKEKSDEKAGEKDKWKKKDVRDYTDADLERLFDQWEV